MPAPRRLAVAAVLAVAAAAGADARAEAPPAGTAADQAPERASGPAGPSGEGGLLDRYSRLMFSFNGAVYGRMDALAQWRDGWWPGGAADPQAPPGTEGALGNVVANLVNEPVTAITALAVGDLPNSWRSVQRFAINSTAGILGYYDTATAWGYGATHTDAGLSLCKAGVGEGPYLVLPFVGPRTTRDAVSDIVLTNLILWTVVGATFGTGASFQTLLVAETIEIVADVVATRQIDPQAKALRFTDYEKTREAYLLQRRARCEDLRRAG
ncbi:MlaA family lipoprotein [Azospirillum thermophilum]|uniref:VacJ-like lipoprotein n=1 Tax=Azospirillum thermophilum TaxID=2202148 RepID=A0A2S2CMI6_9PROT|nr:MlaA family lipoprotein [Azospirillum thermophilum]AWK85723.1 vacJ-like lipoprotein [Azospirillum thermophilum]